jgi:hypothetical protein
MQKEENKCRGMKKQHDQISQAGIISPIIRNVEIEDSGEVGADLVHVIKQPQKGSQPQCQCDETDCGEFSVHGRNSLISLIHRQ